MTTMWALLAILGCAGEAPGPRDVAWDRETCAECGMLVGEARHAAQLETREGEKLVFDDPACLYRHVANERPSVKAMWFHGPGEDEWIPFTDVAFLTDGQTPMGSGLVAVRKGEAGAVTPEEASGIALRAVAP
jgi:copper chaperone NosL